MTGSRCRRSAQHVTTLIFAGAVGKSANSVAVQQFEKRCGQKVHSKRHRPSSQSSNILRPQTVAPAVSGGNVGQRTDLGQHRSHTTPANSCQLFPRAVFVNFEPPRSIYFAHAHLLREMSAKRV
jgi:hypothetical protein